MDLTIAIADFSKRQALFGPADRYLRIIRETFKVQVTARESSIKLKGDSEAVSKAASVFESLQEGLRQGDRLTPELVEAAILAAGTDHPKHNGQVIEVYASSTPIAPKTPGQTKYVEAIRKNDLTFCLGPAGSGKTYLAVALCVSMLKARSIRRLVLVRPAVEAGEKLGYLPGDLQAKVNPYLRPLFDAMHDMMNFDQIQRFMENDIIEVIPLAYMRGRTLNNSAVILDEAQNATSAQMLMFLTRLGHHSKMIVTGDASQTDLPGKQASGLVDAVQRLRGFKDIGIVELDRLDIVRHRLVQTIVRAYDDSGNGNGGEGGDGNKGSDGSDR